MLIKCLLLLILENIKFLNYMVHGAPCEIEGKRLIPQHITVRFHNTRDKGKKKKTNHTHMSRIRNQSAFELFNNDIYR